MQQAIFLLVSFSLMAITYTANREAYIANLQLYVGDTHAVISFYYFFNYYNIYFLLKENV